MAIVHRELEIAAAPSTTRTTWDHFLVWVRSSQHRLACDELACTDAVGTGTVRFEGAEHGGTRVVVEVESDGGPPADVVSQQVIHDLLVFKDYVERRQSGSALSAREGRTRLRDDERRNEPAHLRLSRENQHAPAGGSYTDHYPT